MFNSLLISNLYLITTKVQSISEFVACYSAPLGVRSIVINPSVCASVCLCVCLSVCEHISGTAVLICTKFCVQIPCGRGSVLLRRRCATLCTSGCIDDVTFGRHGRNAKRWRQHSATAINGVAIPGQSLMSMNACFVMFCIQKYVCQHVNECDTSVL